MSDFHSGELRELIAKLSDGSITHDDLGRLNDLLKRDPIAQEEYLDHLLIEGILERQFASDTMGIEDVVPPAGVLSASIGSRAPQPQFRTFAKSWKARAVAASLLLLVSLIIGTMWWARQSGAVERWPLELTDSSFEGATDVLSTGSTPGWHGDGAEMVDHFSNVSPMEGEQMLRFKNAIQESENACEVYQVVDVGAATDHSKSPLSVEASAFFNAIEDDVQENDYVFGVTVFACAEDPSEEPHAWPLRWMHALKFGGSQTEADTDPDSWQRVSTSLPLPEDTRYLVIQLSVVRADDNEAGGEFPGQFVDNVLVNFVTSE